MRIIDDKRLSTVKIQRLQFVHFFPRFCTMTMHFISDSAESTRSFEFAETDTHTRKLTLQGWSSHFLRSTAALPRLCIPREMSDIFVEQSEQTQSGVPAPRSLARTIARLI